LPPHHNVQGPQFCDQSVNYLAQPETQQMLFIKKTNAARRDRRVLRDNIDAIDSVLCARGALGVGIPPELVGAKLLPTVRDDANGQAVVQEPEGIPTAVVDNLRGNVKTLAANLLRDTITYMQHGRHKSVSAHDVLCSCTTNPSYGPSSANLGQDSGMLGQYLKSLGLEHVLPSIVRILTNNKYAFMGASEALDDLMLPSDERAVLKRALQPIVEKHYKPKSDEIPVDALASLGGTAIAPVKVCTRVYLYVNKGEEVEVQVCACCEMSCAMNCARSPVLVHRAQDEQFLLTTPTGLHVSDPGG